MISNLYKRFADGYFKKIVFGTLKVHYPDGDEKVYGSGDEPRYSLHVKSNNFFKRLMLYGDIGFAESYIDEEFECDDLTGVIYLALLNSEHLGVRSDHSKRSTFTNLFPYMNKVKHRLRKNSKTKARKNISDHYDLSNDFYKLMLDETMMYSSAIFEKKEDSLHVAQKKKITHLADKLKLKKGDRVLEIGSGWGAMALHLAQERGCKVTTVTLSHEQKKLCEERFTAHEVEEQIDILLKDYRDLEGTFDAIIAVEMFEAVGKEYFDIFFKKCESLLKPSGILALQVITMPDNRYEEYARSTDFIQKYIFPGGHLPSVERILRSTSRHTRLNLLHMEEFTEDYAKTLNIWHENFMQKLDEIQALGFDKYFIRMWKLYLNYCEAAFLSRNINLVQVTFTRDQNIHINKGLVA